MAEYMLTTVDNPFNPVTQFNEWFNWDSMKGYHTLSLLARVVVTSNELSEADQALAFQDAVNEIVQHNVSGMHRKVLMSTGEPE
jgi:hypothetical protein